MEERMKINQLIYFAMAAKYNNISKASKKLYVSQPAVSLAIKDLEEEFNKRYKDSSIFDVPELDVIYDAEPYVGYLLDILCTGTEEEKKELFIKGRKEVDDIVSRINNIRAGFMGRSSEDSGRRILHNGRCVPAVSEA